MPPTHRDGTDFSWCKFRKINHRARPLAAVFRLAIPLPHQLCAAFVPVGVWVRFDAKKGNLTLSAADYLSRERSSSEVPPSPLRCPKSLYLGMLRGRKVPCALRAFPTQVFVLVLGAQLP